MERFSYQSRNGERDPAALNHLTSQLIADGLLTSLQFLFFLMIRRPPRSTLFPYTTSSDLGHLRARNRRALGRREVDARAGAGARAGRDRKSTRLNSSHTVISYAVFCLKKKNNNFYKPRYIKKKKNK